MKRGFRVGRDMFLGLLRAGGGSGCSDTRNYSITTAGETSARMKKRTSNCRGMHWLD